MAFLWVLLLSNWRKDWNIFFSLHLISLERQQDFLASHTRKQRRWLQQRVQSPPEVHEKNLRNDHVTYSHSTNCYLILSRLLFAPNVMHFLQCDIFTCMYKKKFVSSLRFKISQKLIKSESFLNWDLLHSVVPKIPKNFCSYVESLESDLKALLRKKSQALATKLIIEIKEWKL